MADKPSHRLSSSLPLPPPFVASRRAFQRLPFYASQLLPRPLPRSLNYAFAQRRPRRPSVELMIRVRGMVARGLLPPPPHPVFLLCFSLFGGAGVNTTGSVFAFTSINLLPRQDSGGSGSVAGRQKEGWKEKGLEGWWQRSPMATSGLFPHTAGGCSVRGKKTSKKCKSFLLCTRFDPFLSGKKKTKNKIPIKHTGDLFFSEVCNEWERNEQWGD